MDNQAYLLAEQYRDDFNLASRLSLHERFSTNPYGYQRWIFDRLDLAPDARVLELGCGTGVLWRKNWDRLPDGWDITLSDLSPGMLDAARTQFGDASSRFRFRVVDAQSIPYEDGGFDAVIANHMLYHVPDLSQVLREIGRVLRKGGGLYAATVGRAHLRELDDLIEACLPEAQREDAAERFLLETGEHQLKHWFGKVSLDRYSDSLVVTEVDPVVAYVLSTPAGRAFDGDGIERLRWIVGETIRRDGAFRVTKDAGLFIALDSASPNP